MLIYLFSGVAKLNKKLKCIVATFSLNRFNNFRRNTANNRIIGNVF